MARYFILSTRKDCRLLAFRVLGLYLPCQLSGLLRTHLGKPTLICWPSRSWTRRGTAVDWYTRAPLNLPSFPRNAGSRKTRLQGRALSDIERRTSLRFRTAIYKNLCGAMRIGYPFPHAGMPVHLSLPSGRPANPPQPVLVCFGA